MLGRAVLILSLATACTSVGSWEEIMPMPTPRSNVGSVILQDGTFLTVGGSEIKGNKAVVTNVIEQYFPSKNSWITWNVSMPTSRTNYGAAIHHDELYLVGGQTEGGKSTATVDILNLQTMKWRSGPPLPYVLMGHRVVSLHRNQGIMVIGGFTMSKIYHKTDFHNETLILVDGGWKKTKTGLPYRVSDFGVAVSKQSNLVYAVGGAMTFPGYAHVAVFNPETKEWAHAGQLNVPRSYAACACSIDKAGKELLLVIGGMDGEFRPTNSVEVANIENVSKLLNFTSFEDFPVARGAMTAGTVNHGSEVIVVGGVSAYKILVGK